MHEDGIGMARTFELEFEGRADTATGVRSGFFAAVDLPSNPAAYTGLARMRRARHQRRQPVRSAHSVASATVVLTGEFGARVIGPLIDGSVATTSACCPSANEFFGGNTGVTGLMTGADLTRVLGARAGRRSLPAARRLPVRRRALSRRRHRRRAAASGRGRGHRRHLAAARARGGGMTRHRDSRPS